MGASKQPDRVCVGTINGARGVHGELRIKTYTEDPLSVAAYGPVETEDGFRRFVLEKVRLAGTDVCARVAEVTSREEAVALKGTNLYVAREALPEAEAEEEYYHSDLLGLAVEEKEKGRIGEVIAVQDFGAGDLLELRLDETGKTVYVPFTRDIVPIVNVKEGVIVVDPAEGMLDPGAKKDAEKKEANKKSG